jgi:hypothetical protein
MLNVREKAIAVVNGAQPSRRFHRAASRADRAAADGNWAMYDVLADEADEIAAELILARLAKLKPAKADAVLAAVNGM